MSITRETSDGIAVVTMDDGKANAFDLERFHLLDAVLDECADDAAVVIAGRQGIFSGGLNTKILGGLDPDGFAELLLQFGETMLRVWTEPRPVLVAADGHAVAGGTILAMAADHAVAADGDFRWGLVETTIGMPVVDWIQVIARANLAPSAFDDLVLPGRTVTPHEAVEVGYADALAAPGAVLEAALERAGELAALPRHAYAATKRRIREDAAEAARGRMAADLAEAAAGR